MAYCTTDDVGSLNKARPFGVGENPTVNDVQGYINMIAGEIDQILITKGYVVPVDISLAPEASAYLNGVNATGAWYLMERSSQSSVNLDRAAKAWEDAKAALMKAREVMDIPKDTTRASPRGPGVSTPPQMPCGERPFFRRHQHF